MTHRFSALKVALVGCGAVAQLYYRPALAELEAHTVLEVRALFDPHPASLAHLQQAFPTAVSVQGLEELPGLGIKLAIVASPPRLHAEQTQTLLRAGLAVLCEKPLAATVSEAEAMLATARTTRQPLAVGLVRRFFPATRMIRDLLARGVLGNIEHFACFEGGPFAWPVQSAAFFQKTGAQGGVLLDIGVHVLDLLLWWWGQPVEVFYEDDAMGGIEANCRLKLTFAGGISGTVRLSRDCSLPNCYVIQGTQGWIRWQANDANRLAIGFHDSDLVLEGGLYHRTHENLLPTYGSPGFTFEQSFVSQLENVVAAIRGAAPLMVPGEQALPSLQLIEYCYQHRALMAMPWLHDQEFVPTQTPGRQS